eukprot:g3223.t1
MAGATSPAIPISPSPQRSHHHHLSSDSDDDDDANHTLDMSDISADSACAGGISGLPASIEDVWISRGVVATSPNNNPTGAGAGGRPISPSSESAGAYDRLRSLQQMTNNSPQDDEGGHLHHGDEDDDHRHYDVAEAARMREALIKAQEQMRKLVKHVQETTKDLQQAQEDKEEAVAKAAVLAGALEEEQASRRSLEGKLDGAQSALAQLHGRLARIDTPRRQTGSDASSSSSSSSRGRGKETAGSGNGAIATTTNNNSNNRGHNFRPLLPLTPDAARRLLLVKLRLLWADGRGAFQTERRAQSWDDLSTAEEKKTVEDAVRSAMALRRGAGRQGQQRGGGGCAGGGGGASGGVTGLLCASGRPQQQPGQGSSGAGGQKPTNIKGNDEEAGKAQKISSGEAQDPAAAVAVAAVAAAVVEDDPSGIVAAPADGSPLVWTSFSPAEDEAAELQTRSYQRMLGKFFRLPETCFRRVALFLPTLSVEDKEEEEEEEEEGGSGGKEREGDEGSEGAAGGDSKEDEGSSGNGLRGVGGLTLHMI